MDTEALQELANLYRRMHADGWTMDWGIDDIPARVSCIGCIESMRWDLDSNPHYPTSLEVEDGLQKLARRLGFPSALDMAHWARSHPNLWPGGDRVEDPEEFFFTDETWGRVINFGQLADFMDVVAQRVEAFNMQQAELPL